MKQPYTSVVFTQRQVYSATLSADQTLLRPLVLMRRTPGPYVIQDENFQWPHLIAVQVHVVQTSCDGVFPGMKITLSNSGSTPATLTLLRRIQWTMGPAYILKLQDPEQPCVHQILALPEDVLRIQDSQVQAKVIDTFQQNVALRNRNISQKFLEHIGKSIPGP